MNLTRLVHVLPLHTLAFSATSCRVVQINKLGERVNNIEDRTAALEAKVDMLLKK